MSLQRIAVERGRRGVATITLNRPDRGNAYDDVMLRELLSELASIDKDNAIRAVVLRGAGKHFCVGADIAWHRSNQDASAQPREPGPKLIDMLLALDALSKPTIAILHGAAVGGGLAFAACCDVALAVEDAFFSIPEVRIGLVPGPLVPIFLRAMDYRAFRRYGLSGERFSAGEALRCGLVHQIGAADAIEAALSRLIEDILLGAPGAIAGLKAIAARLAPPPLAEAMLRDLEQAGRGMLETDEAKEGVASFLEKRRPSWYPKV
ncbi:MAG TPA: enoyl-CoA hydratase-related protein [Stellaceae bacterium]|nr:enoyl-CoA hydratase-related protein [Stellaceae bacterium]